MFLLKVNSLFEYSGTTEVKHFWTSRELQCCKLPDNFKRLAWIQEQRNCIIFNTPLQPGSILHCTLERYIINYPIVFSLGFEKIPLHTQWSCVHYKLKRTLKQKHFIFTRILLLVYCRFVSIALSRWIELSAWGTLTQFAFTLINLLWELELFLS